MAHRLTCHGREALWDRGQPVIFDFYGTLARFADTSVSNYEMVLTAHGYRPERAVLDNYFARYDGVEHGEHSRSEEAYESWVRLRLRDLTSACSVPDPHVDGLIDALRASDQGDMVPYPESVATLESLRVVRVCHRRLFELGLGSSMRSWTRWGCLGLVDVGVTSARAGARKPHPDIYRTSVSALEVEPAEVVFVGDSWEPDVRGPRKMGMTAVHVWREEERPGMDPPALQPGDHRVGDLTGVLGIVDGLRVAGPAEGERLGRPIRP